ncbi:CHAP domain-containing protein [Komagataeibacter sp. FNDCF1]|uniref:CHAP domain-containing protein n=1 Tax=Komagataeibacter sp. FNDCF1 TaxID=2878681 RepID=UPI0021057612|nr:CHAP domain-containing protein [Komagataeibacter sp. FNDCF1]
MTVVRRTVARPGPAHPIPALAARVRAAWWRLGAGGALLSLAACAGGSGQGWHGAVQCAPYARQVTHMQMQGDAASWWGQAQGRYPRGHAPRPGAVLVFRATGRLPDGHVSVVRAVRGPREVLVDQANWVPGRIGRSEPVVDVSGRNDWSRVRVWWSPIHDMGKTVYPAYGFILPAG